MADEPVAPDGGVGESAAGGADPAASARKPLQLFPAAASSDKKVFAAAKSFRPMRGIRSTVKAKPKSLAKESVGSIKDGASLISAVASDLTMAKRLGSDKYLGTQMESTLSSSAPNMRPLVFSQAEALFDQEMVEGDVATKDRA